MTVAKRMAEATGLSERTVRDIHKEHVACDGQLLTPVKRYTASQVRINLDTFDREAIRPLVYAFYIRRKYPTIAAVLEKAREECGFPGGRFCLCRVLKGIGFTYKGGRCWVEVMTLTITPDSDEDSEDEDLIDRDDRQIIDSTGTVKRLTLRTHRHAQTQDVTYRDHPTVGPQPSECRTTSFLNRTVQNQPGSHSR